MTNPLLFQPTTLRGLEVRNRLWVAPMCQYAVEERDGVPRDWHMLHIGGMARGGAGLVVVEATAVAADGRISPEDLGLWNDEQADAFAPIVSVAQAQGAKVSVQLAHAGRKASSHRDWPGEPRGSVSEEDGGWETVGPSPIAFSDAYTAPRELTVAEIAEHVELFAAAADRAVRAGFDAVEIHAAHGYLLQSFLSPLSNKREDEYGGPLENRARFTREVIAEIRGRHPELPIMVRISGTEWVDGGFDVQDAATVSAWFAEDGADLVHVSSAGNTPVSNIKPGPSYQVPLAAHIRDELSASVATSGTKVGAVGMISTASQAEAVLVTGQADVVFLGRPIMANPHLPLAWAAELHSPAAADFVPPAYHRARY